MLPQQIIQRYEVILAESSEMVAAARENRWDDLIELETTRRAHIVEVTAESATPFADAVMQANKQRLIRAILDADAQVKSLTEAWMAEISGILTSVQAERKLARAYQTG